MVFFLKKKHFLFEAKIEESIFEQTPGFFIWGRTFELILDREIENKENIKLIII